MQDHIDPETGVRCQTMATMRTAFVSIPSSLPAEGGPSYPVIWPRTPYGITNAGGGANHDVSRVLPDPAEPLRGSILRGWRNIVAHGYAAVYQIRADVSDQRARTGYMRTTSDGWDTLEWIASRMTNGRVGMSGSSAGATTTYAAASTKHPSRRHFCTGWRIQHL